MTLQIFTGRLWCGDPDAFNITRGSGGAAADPFAPSHAILRPALRARKRVEKMRSEGKARDADALDDREWIAYSALYLSEMRISYVLHRAAWEEFLSRPRVVLTCYCPRRERCHRGLLAGVLAKCGAIDRGELQERKRGSPLADLRRQVREQLAAKFGTDVRSLGAARRWAAGVLERGSVKVGELDEAECRALLTVLR